MIRHVDQEYEKIRRALLRMGGLVEEMIEKARRALETRDAELALQVVRADREVDAAEKEIDEDCHTILALQQPTAVDLRFLVAVMKITTDLERIGDLAANISRSVRSLVGQAPLPINGDIGELFAAARRMVSESLDAFVRKDAELALAVWKRDDEIDERYREFFARLIAATEQEPARVEPNFQLIIVGRSLERIADHATNIAEDVIYFVQGQDIRHAATDYGEDEASGDPGD